MAAIDAMVDPDFRRQGILTALVEEAHKTWRLEGVAWVLAMPNEQWSALNEWVGWRKAFPLKWHIRPLRLEKIAFRRLGLNFFGASPISWIWNRSRRLNPEKGLVIEGCSEAGEVFDELWERLKLKRRVGDFVSIG